VIEVNVTFDASDVDRMIRWLYADQIPFATSRAINAVAKKAQAETRQRIQNVFEIRNRLFATRAIKIKPFASKRRLWAELKVEPPGGPSRADIFAKFETGGVKRPRGQRLAVPTDEVKRLKSGRISKKHRLRELDFQPHGHRGVFKTKGTGVFVGKKRTIMIKKSGGRGVVLQRVGRGKNSQLRLLYTFIPQARIDDRLEFEKTVKDVVSRDWEREMRDAFADAVRTAR